MQQPFSLTYEDLRRFCPRGKRDILKGLAQHSSLLVEYGLSRNELRLCHFLAQAAHETAGFRTLVEYGSTGYFRRRYGHRRDLGNRGRLDGSRYRGRGIFQLTGRANYRRYGTFIEIDLEKSPHLAAKIEVSLRIACEYWKRNNLNKYADLNDIRTITRRINGGFNGLDERRRYMKRALLVWSKGAATIAAKPLPRLFLRAGARGPRVMRLQHNLRSLGFFIVIDGIFGPRTRAAMKRFQRKYGLLRDGIYGPRSKKMMARKIATSRKSPSPTSKETTMKRWKNYLQSRTIWANLVGFAALGLNVLGFNGISPEEQSQLVGHLLNLVQAGGFIAAVLFRAIARERLGPRLFSK